ncbi:MAG: hypothetical protein R3348_06540, partial [Xanthomonadales bacterium]|nr:hypothetical protein [Xanthomonadales bacterium]
MKFKDKGSVLSRFALCTFAVFCGAGLAIADDKYPSTQGYQLETGYDPVARQIKQLDLAMRLRSQAPVAMGQGFRIQLTAQEFAQIGQGDGPAPGVETEQEKRYQVGITKAVGRDVSFAGIGQSRGRGPSEVAQGTLQSLGHRLVWDAQFASPEAHAVRVHLSQVDLADGVELYFYNAAGQAFGPYGGQGPMSNGTIWSPTLVGTEANIRLEAANEAALKASSFRVEEISHIGP